MHEVGGVFCKTAVHLVNWTNSQQGKKTLRAETGTGAWAQHNESRPRRQIEQMGAGLGELLTMGQARWCGGLGRIWCGLERQLGLGAMRGGWDGGTVNAPSELLLLLVLKNKNRNSSRSRCRTAAVMAWAQVGGAGCGESNQMQGMGRGDWIQRMAKRLGQRLFSGAPNKGVHGVERGDLVQREREMGSSGKEAEKKKREGGRATAT